MTQKQETLSLTWIDSTGSLKLESDQKFTLPSAELDTKPSCFVI
jgi:hypothetical protein